MRKIALFALLGLTAAQCTYDPNIESLFTQMEPTKIGIGFQNDLSYDKDFNVFNYRNFYNGGGVAVGDINNDGYVDLYFTANQTSNKLYLNNGDWTFTDITDASGTNGQQAWSTGAAMADVNGDGWLDIYVANSGDIRGDSRANELFLNNGDDTFTEAAEAWGVADQGLSTHGVFFDYDRDGDLDLYVLNNSYRAIGSFNLQKSSREIRDPEGGDKLYRNEGDHFTDVSEAAGIMGSEIGFGLGTTVGDVNGDGWLDIYISNDFFEKDYLYINQGNGTFSEELEQHMRHTSFASMGADMADINNDGAPDLFVTDMLPQGVRRLNQTTTFENWDVYQGKLDWGYYHQFNRNMLHLNTEDGDFIEIGQLSGVEATDWSWGALIADLDNDGWRDLYISNGIAHDLTDQDYINYISNEEVMRSIVTEEGVNYKELIDLMPTTRIPNYAYKNVAGGYKFVDQAKEWGLNVPSHSNGSVYADLDNDGDLDLVVNNVNQAPFIWRNNAETIHPENHSIQIELREGGKMSIGAKVYAYAEGNRFYAENVPMKGFQSSVDPRIHIGLGAHATLDSLIVVWGNEDRTVRTNVPADQLYTIVRDELAAGMGLKKDHKAGYLTMNSTYGGRTETPFSQFNEERLIPQMTTTEGARLAMADVNGDGYMDFFQCGSTDQPGQLFFGSDWYGFEESIRTPFIQHAACEDTDAQFFDYDGDGDLDLYVASGAMEAENGSDALVDRIYKNDGRGHFTYDANALPNLPIRTSSIAVADFDGDGLDDVFVGVRGVKGRYGVPGSSLFYKNYGDGVLRNERLTSRGFERIGMLTDCAAGDVDGDGDQDLVAVGDWQGVRLWMNDGGRFAERTLEAGFNYSQGLWNTIRLEDLDGDGALDIVAGNLGENCRLEASPEKPMVLFVNDFDANTYSDPILCSYWGDTLFPRVLRHNLISQLPYLKKENLKYADYAGKSVFEVFDTTQLERSALLQVQTLRTTCFYNNGNGVFAHAALPIQAQTAPVYAIDALDVDGDGDKDLVLGGNLYEVQPEWGRYDGSRGTVLLNTGNREWRAATQLQSGLNIDGQVRDIVHYERDGEIFVLFSKVDGPLEEYKLSN